MLRRHSRYRFLPLILLAFFVFSAVEWHSNHDGSRKQAGADTQCCVQCCPSHNLGPLTVEKVVMTSFNPCGRLTLTLALPHLNPIIAAIYRPPIVAIA
jgi:hypothetical protein